LRTRYIIPLDAAEDEKANEQMLPELRTDLFGKNANRKFYTVSHARAGHHLRTIADMQ